jgi:hypothetical protein
MKRGGRGMNRRGERRLNEWKIGRGKGRGRNRRGGVSEMRKGGRMENMGDRIGKRE